MLYLLLSILPLTMLFIFLSQTKEEMLIISLIGSIFNLIQILIIGENLNFFHSRFQYLSFDGLIGIDGLSYWLIWLTSILLPIIILNTSFKKLNKMK